MSPLCINEENTEHASFSTSAAFGEVRQAAITSLAAGGTIIVSHGPRAFFLADAAAVTPEMINQMVTYGKGVVGVAMPMSRVIELGLSFQSRRGRSNAPLYTQSIEARSNIETGISARDRALTIKVAVDGGADDLATPGHIFPYVAEGRADCQADIALRLLEEAGKLSLGVTCSILSTNGSDIVSRQTLDDMAQGLGIVHLDIGDGAASVIGDPPHFGAVGM